MKKFALLSLIAVFVSAVAFAPDIALAQGALDDACRDSSSSSALCGDQNGGTVENVVQIIINTLLFIVGIISVIMIVVGGFRLSLSGGDHNAVVAGRNTVLYSVIGLVVALVAYAIVTWVFAAIQ